MSLSGPGAAPPGEPVRPVMVVAGLAYRGNDEVVIVLTVAAPEQLAPVTVVVEPELARKVRDQLDDALRQQHEPGS